jgi:hypothetical protein
VTFQELAAEIVRLPVHERLALLELVSHSLREDLAPQPQVKSLAARLRGIARPVGPMPSDTDIENDYISYHEEKYA